MVQASVGIGLNGVDGTFWLAHSAIDAFVGVDHQHIFAFVKAVNRTNFHAVRVFAFDAAFRHDVGHISKKPFYQLPLPRRSRVHRPWAIRGSRCSPERRLTRQIV